jgi:hypothetical protein
VHGDVYPSNLFKTKQLPVQFGEVGGHFICSGMGLKTLVGAPHRCEGDFDCTHNSLTNLMHAPSYVDRGFWCVHNPLTSLEGIPEHVGGSVWCMPSPQLPLLRLCMYAHVDFDGWGISLRNIMQKYVGTGKPGAIKCAAELVRAGYKENARW